MTSPQPSLFMGARALAKCVKALPARRGIRFAGTRLPPESDFEMLFENSDGETAVIRVPIEMVINVVATGDSSALLDRITPEYKKLFTAK